MECPFSSKTYRNFKHQNRSPIPKPSIFTTPRCEPWYIVHFITGWLLGVSMLIKIAAPWSIFGLGMPHETSVGPWEQLGGPPRRPPSNGSPDLHQKGHGAPWKSLETYRKFQQKMVKHYKENKRKHIQLIEIVSHHIKILGNMWKIDVDISPGISVQPRVCPTKCR